MQTKASPVIVAAILSTLTCCKSPVPAPEPAVPAPTAEPTTRTAVVAPTPAPAPVPAPPARTSMVPARPAVLTLKFTSGSMDAIEAGTKTSTTRKGIREFPGNKVTAIDSGDPERTLNLDIISAIPKKLSDLTDADAKSDGSDSLDAMKTAMTTNYPGITGDDVVTVVTFKVAK